APGPNPLVPAGPTSGPRGAEPSIPGGGHLPDLVVLLALGLVPHHVVGSRDLLEPLLGFLVAAVPVRVVFLGELPVRLLDLRRRGVLRHAEHLVVVLLEPL